MALSGTQNFNMTVSDLLSSALRLSGVIGQGEVASSEQFDIAIESLNLQLHQLDVNDVPLWKRGFYDFKPSESSYVTNGGSTYRCVTGHTSASDTEPGVGDLWQTYWVLDTDPSGTPSAWALSTAYTTSIEVSVPDRFYDILICTTLQNSSNEVNVAIISFEDYTAIINAKRTSLVSTIPLYVAFDNNISNKMYIYPQPTDTFSSTMRLYGILKPDDADANNQDIDIPVRYLNMLRFNVALDIAFQYQVSSEDISILKRQAQYYLDEYRKSNRERNTQTIVKGAY